MSYGKILTTLAIGFVFALAGGLGHDANAKSKKAPIVLEEHGQFWAGGQVVNSTDPGNEDDLILVGQAYVEYFIPKAKGAGKLPVVMSHTSINSTIFLTTPDGREGWVDFFLRRGYPVYIIDPPGTGRAGFPVGQFERVRAGLDDPSTLPSLSQRDSSSWENENMGPEFGEHGPVDPTCVGNDGRGDPPVTCHGWRMPNDEESLKQWLAHGLPQGGSAIPGDTGDAFVAVLERIGKPVIWLGWSAGGRFGGDLVSERPELFKVLIGVEPANNCLYRPGFIPTAGSVAVPALSIHGVNQIGRPSQPGRLSRADCEDIYDDINMAGGDVTWISLLDIGIFGTSHMTFWEDNNDEVAEVLLDWIKKRVKH